MEIKYSILPKQKNRRHSLDVKINLYNYASELYSELDNISIINRINEVPQLGALKVKKKFSKSKFDYIMLQMYIHSLIKSKLQRELRYTYNNYISSTEFGNNFKYQSNQNRPTIGDALQLLSIISNIGHFYNTFTSSRATIMMANENDDFKKLIINASKDERYQYAAKKLIEEKNYQRFHLLNSILILEKCDKSKEVILLSLALLYSYINESSLPEDSKLKYVFNIYRKVRTLSYITYDLQVAKTPLAIDISDDDEIVLLLKELLSEYNNQETTIQLFYSANKLLDDTVYHENSNGICNYRISKQMVNKMKKELNFSSIDYYNDLFNEKNSILNKHYNQKRDYVQSHILKLTFAKEQREVSEKLVKTLEKIHNIRVGSYDRHLGEQTILVSIKNNCDSNDKRYAAFKTLKYVISHLKSIPNISPYDDRFLLTVKFYLYYLFDENPVIIMATIDKNICTVCTRGKVARVTEIKKLLKNSIGTKDENHEVEFLLSQIINDSKSDTTITIPASIVVSNKNQVGKKLCEFDGLIIHPTRKTEQVIFLEAKNTKYKPSYGKNCLQEKFDYFTTFNDKKEISIQIENKDAYFKFSIKKKK